MTEPSSLTATSAGVRTEQRVLYETACAAHLAGDPHRSLSLTEKALKRAVGKYRFETLYGRKLGEENTASHGRQGAPGNWRKHFTPRVAQAFAQRFGQLLIDTGYERDLAWANLPG